VSVASAVKTRLDDRLSQVRWRLRNRDRAKPGEVPPDLQDVVRRLRRDGVVITGFATVFGETALYDEAAAEARRRYDERPPDETDAQSGSKATFLTKLGDPSYALDHPFARIATHPRALAVANGYLKIESTLRALDVWHTHPTLFRSNPDPALAPRRRRRREREDVRVLHGRHAGRGTAVLRARHAPLRLAPRATRGRRAGAVDGRADGRRCARERMDVLRGQAGHR
jgi:hypothetical protein